MLLSFFFEINLKWLISGIYFEVFINHEKYTVCITIDYMPMSSISCAASLFENW